MARTLRMSNPVGLGALELVVAGNPGRSSMARSRSRSRSRARRSTHRNRRGRFSKRGHFTMSGRRSKRRSHVRHSAHRSAHRAHRSHRARSRNPARTAHRSHRGARRGHHRGGYRRSRNPAVMAAASGALSGFTQLPANVKSIFAGKGIEKVASITAAVGGVVGAVALGTLISKFTLPLGLKDMPKQFGTPMGVRLLSVANYYVGGAGLAFLFRKKPAIYRPVFAGATLAAIIEFIKPGTIASIINRIPGAQKLFGPSGVQTTESQISDYVARALEGEKPAASMGIEYDERGDGGTQGYVDRSMEGYVDRSMEGHEAGTQDYVTRDDDLGSRHGVPDDMLDQLGCVDEASGGELVRR